MDGLVDSVRDNVKESGTVLTETWDTEWTLSEQQDKAMQEYTHHSYAD